MCVPCVRQRKNITELPQPSKASSRVVNIQSGKEATKMF